MPEHPLSKEQKLRYFRDPECREPMYAIEFPDPVVRGEEVAELTVYAKNVTPEELDNLQFIPQDPDLKIEFDRNHVKPYEVIMLKFVFTPSETRNKALDAEFVVQGRAIMRGSHAKGK